MARSAAGLFDTRVCPAKGCHRDYPCPEHPHALPNKNDKLLYAALALISIGKLDPLSPKLAEAVGRHPYFCVHEPARVLGVIKETSAPRDILYRRMAAKALNCAEAELWLRELRSALVGELPETTRYDRTSARRAELVSKCRQLPPALAREVILNPASPRPQLLLEHEETHGLSRAQTDDDWRRAKTQLLEHRLVELLAPHVT
jgi:hypothetical protein